MDEPPENVVHPEYHSEPDQNTRGHHAAMKHNTTQAYRGVY